MLIDIMVVKIKRVTSSFLVTITLPDFSSMMLKDLIMMLRDILDSIKT